MAIALKKDEAHSLVEKMPEGATWDDLMSEIYVRQVIEEGLEDSDAGRSEDVRSVRAKYGLPPDRIDVLAVIHGAMDVLRRQ